MLTLLTAVLLLSGAAVRLANIHLDSVVMSHSSQSAMIFGLVGLRRTAHSAVEAQGKGDGGQT